MNNKTFENLNNQYDKGLEFRKIADNRMLWCCRAIIGYCCYHILYQNTYTILFLNEFWNHFIIFILFIPCELTLLLDYISTRKFSHILENVSNGGDTKFIKYVNSIGSFCFYFTLLIINIFLFLYEFYGK